MIVVAVIIIKDVMLIPIVATLLGIITDDNAVQLAKRQFPIEDIDFSSFVNSDVDGDQCSFVNSDDGDDGTNRSYTTRNRNRCQP